VSIPDFQSEAEVEAWLRSGPPPAEVMALLERRRPNSILEQVAAYYPVSRLSPAQLDELAKNDTRLQLVCLNPDLTDVQARRLLFSALERSLDGESSSGFSTLWTFLGRAGRALPRDEVLARLRAGVEKSARQVEEAQRRREFLGSISDRAVFPLLRRFWYEITEADLDLCLAASPNSSMTAADIVQHPRASLDLARRVADAYSKESSVMTALARSPHIVQMPDVMAAMLAERNPWVCAALAPQLSDERLRALVGEMAALHAARALNFVSQMERSQLHRLRTTDLLPLLQSEDAEHRLKAQALVAQVGAGAAIDAPGAGGKRVSSEPPEAPATPMPATRLAGRAL
jgi:hypothetical protein